MIEGLSLAPGSLASSGPWEAVMFTATGMAWRLQGPWSWAVGTLCGGGDPR